MGSLLVLVSLFLSLPCPRGGANTQVTSCRRRSSFRTHFSQGGGDGEWLGRGIFSVQCPYGKQQPVLPLFYPPLALSYLAMVDGLACLGSGLFVKEAWRRMRR